MNFMSILLFLLGFIASVYGIIIGAGGGFIIVPFLILFFDTPSHIAAGTGLAIVFLNSISGLYVYLKQGRVLIRQGVLFGVAAIPGTFVGLFFVQQISEHWFQYGLAVLLVGLGIYITCKKPPEVAEVRYTSANERPQIFLLLVIGLIIGTISSFFGIGGGWLLVPILIYLFRIDAYRATATSVFSLGIYSFVGAASAVGADTIDWQLLTWCGAGAVIGAYVGARMSRRFNASAITKLLAALVFVIAVLLVI